jgi:RNA polymerase subunit RPABC4/transcription elongation factor Spt4
MDHLWRCSHCSQWISEEEPICPFCDDPLDTYEDGASFVTPIKRQKTTIDVVSDSDGEDLYASGSDSEPFSDFLMKWSCGTCRAVYDVAIPDCPDCENDVEVATPLSLTRAKSCGSDSDLASGQIEDTINKTERIVESLTRCYETAFANACEAVVYGDDSKKRSRPSAAKELCRSVVLCKPGVAHMSQRGGVQLGSGWACGYRNIQMLCSSLLGEPAFKAALFGGCGFIPEIPFIQAWIQRAWRRGKCRFLVCVLFPSVRVTVL